MNREACEALRMYAGLANDLRQCRDAVNGALAQGHEAAVVEEGIVAWLKIRYPNMWPELELSDGALDRALGAAARAGTWDAGMDALACESEPN